MNVINFCLAVLAKETSRDSRGSFELIHMVDDVEAEAVSLSRIILLPNLNYWREGFYFALATIILEVIIFFFSDHSSSYDLYLFFFLSVLSFIVCELNMRGVLRFRSVELSEQGFVVTNWFQSRATTWQSVSEFVCREFWNEGDMDRYLYFRPSAESHTLLPQNIMSIDAYIGRSSSPESAEEIRKWFEYLRAQAISGSWSELTRSIPKTLRVLAQ